MGWQDKFDKPVKLPNGHKLHTVRDAANYILASQRSLTKLRKDSPEHQRWATAIETVMMAGEGKGPVMHANAGMIMALYPEKPGPPEPPAKKAKKYHVVK